MRLLFLLLVACDPQPPQPPPEPQDALMLVAARLDEAAELNAEGRSLAAEAAWTSALELFEERIEPWYRFHHGDKATAELEYRFGLVRHEMQKRRGAPATRVAEINNILAPADG